MQRKIPLRVLHNFHCQRIDCCNHLWKPEGFQGESRGCGICMNHLIAAGASSDPRNAAAVKAAVHRDGRGRRAFQVRQVPRVPQAPQVPRDRWEEAARGYQAPRVQRAPQVHQARQAYVGRLAQQVPQAPRGSLVPQVLQALRVPQVLQAPQAARDRPAPPGQRGQRESLHRTALPPL